MPGAPELPLIDVSGRARERGQAHGETMRGAITEGLELAREAGAGQAPRDGSQVYLDAARRWTPSVVEELRGIADGAAVPFEAIFEYNLGDERRVFARSGRCSSVGLRRGDRDRPVSGQTMDTPAWFARTRVAVRSVESESGLTTLAFTIAGVPALCGVNSAGVSVWCNALYQLRSAADGVPVACVVRHLLSSPSLDVSTARVRALPHASGQHYLLGGPDGLASFECSGPSVAEVPFSANAVWHTNHPLASRDRDGGVDGESSLARGAFLEQALASARSDGDLRNALGDRTVPVCKTGDGGGDGYTLWAAVALHSVPPLVAATAGPPSQARWVPVALDVQR